MPAAKTPTAADLYGYRFGVDGVVDAETAAGLLAISVRTLRDLSKPDKTGRSKIRRGLRTPGVWQSGAIYCRRSIREHLASLEL